jgi:hypothetical protein
MSLANREVRRLTVLSQSTNLRGHAMTAADRRGSVLRLVLALSMLVAARPANASANNFGSDVCNTEITSQCVARTGSLVWYASSVGAPITTAVLWADTNRYDPIAEVQMVQTTNTSLADTWVLDGSYGMGFRAFTRCSNTAVYGVDGGETWCEDQLISFNNGSYPSEFNNIDKRRHVACHEIGHVLGLHHPSTSNSSCMVSLALGSPLAEYSSRTDLTSHDISELNNYYLNH